MNHDTAGAPLLSLLHLCDSLFPVGAFGHSDGLETATANGSIATGNDLGCWMDACLDEIFRRSDGPAVLLAWTACVEGSWSALQELDAEAYALRPSSTSRAASRAMGARLLKTWDRIYPGGGNAKGDDRLLGTMRVTLPVAFGVVSATAGVGRDSALAGYAYTRLAATISAAMRLVPIGQGEAHGLLADRLARVPAVVAAVIDGVAGRGERPRAFTPALDIALMGQQVLYIRVSSDHDLIVDQAHGTNRHRRSGRFRQDCAG